MGNLSPDGTPWTDARRVEYLRSVREKLQGFPLMFKAMEVGTLADPYAPYHEVRRCVSEINAVLESYE